MERACLPKVDRSLPAPSTPRACFLRFLKPQNKCQQTPPGHDSSCDEGSPFITLPHKPIITPCPSTSSASPHTSTKYQQHLLRSSISHGPNAGSPDPQRQRALILPRGYHNHETFAYLRPVKLPQIMDNGSHPAPRPFIQHGERAYADNQFFNVHSKWPRESLQYAQQWDCTKERNREPGSQCSPSSWTAQVLGWHAQDRH